MLAVDTNVVVRFLLNDDPAQANIARRLIEGHDIWVPLTVLLETEWVLRSAARLDPDRIQRLLTDFIRLPRVTVEARERATQALAGFAHGMDFADAIHLVSSADCAAFATFDRKMAAAAKKAGAGKIKVL